MLRDTLKGSKYLGKFEKIEKESEDMLPNIRKIFQTYTNHDISHSKGVEDLINRMLPKKVKENLLVEEIFCLLSSVYLHDIGMVASQAEENKFYNYNDEEKRIELQNDIRNNHHIRSKNYILQNKDDLGLSKIESIVISKISEAHREININSLYDLSYNGKKLKIPFLAAILRIADECHITEDRNSKLFSKTVDSYLFEKHFKIQEIITSIDFDEKTNESIIISGIVENEEELSILLDSERKILTELKKVEDILSQNGFPLRKVKSNLELDELVKKRILICLANNNELQSIENKWISEELIDNNLNDLVSLKLVFDNKKTLNNSLEKFKYLVKLFFGTKKYEEFIETAYAQTCIKNLFSEFKKKYNVHFEVNEEKYRINVLLNSPSALYIILFWDELINNPYINIQGLQAGNVILDNMILLGFSYNLHTSKKLDSNELENSLNHILEDNKNNFRKKYLFYKKVWD